MSDDWNNCVMVIILFILTFMYYTYLKTILELKRDWRNFKCNPIYMLFSSLTKPKDSKHGNNVERCVRSVFDSTYNQTDVNILQAEKLYSGVSAVVQRQEE